MFSIIVSEKGGAERREQYDKTEISVGRVQGNDLMLPKGNVSKRHARLLYRDGRFIVTDLKSTNGTYVNGRKIAQATIVREGDKIYIGDFILRIETAESKGVLALPVVDEASSSVSSSEAPDAEAAGDSQGGHEPSRPSQPSSAERALQQQRALAPRIEPKPAEHTASRPSHDIISHFPLEQDPDESAPAYQVPGPPRMPSAPRPISFRASGPPVPVSSAPITSSPPAFRSGSAPGGLPTPVPGSPPAGAHSSSAPGSVTPAGRRAIPPAPEGAVRPQSTAHRDALALLVDRTQRASGLAESPLEAPVTDEVVERVERLLDEHVTAMKGGGELPAEIDADALALEARRELLELGPLGPLLEDEEVSEIQVLRHDYVLALHGRKQVAGEVAFTSERAVARALARLCASAGRPLGAGEIYVERRLPTARLFAVLPPASTHGHMLVLRKSQRADLSLEDLVRSGTISRGMATLLAACVAAHANVLITGSLGAGTTSLLGALAGAGSTDDRVVVLQEDDELVLNQPHAVSILVDDGDDGAKALWAAARVHPDRLIVGAFAGRVAAEVVDAIGDGVHGVLAAARAPTLRQAVLRLPADIAATRPGLTPDAAREWLASAFDLAIEVARLRDGRHRVLRIAELAVEGTAVAVRDIFSFAVERTAAGGSLEGTFHATGVVPRIVEDLNARGVGVDPSIFKRHPGR